MTKLLLSVEELDTDFKNMIKQLSPYAEIDVTDTENISLENYDIFVGKKLTDSQLEQANKLQAIFTYKTGVDNFPLETINSKNIPLINSHASVDIIAEFSFTLCLNLLNHINKFDHDLRNSVWIDKNDPYWESIFTKKIGLLGYGQIGKAIKKLLDKFDIETYTINYEDDDYSNIKTVNNLTMLIKNCDVIISSLPKTPETDNIFNKQTFALMKDKYLVNVGRSNIINEEDLYEALENHLIKGIAIDTWNNEPKDDEQIYPSKYNFNKFHNIILLPHAATRTKDGHRFYVEDTTNRILDYIKFHKITNLVDTSKGF